MQQRLNLRGESNAIPQGYIIKRLDAEVVTRATTLTGSAAPAEDVRRMIEHSLAAWGIPIPRIIQPARSDEFASRLAEAGEYAYEADGVRVTVKRSA